MLTTVITSGPEVFNASCQRRRDLEGPVPAGPLHLEDRWLLARAAEQSFNLSLTYRAGVDLYACLMWLRQ
ncbi:hypothetical protein [Arthrobacter sp. Soil764]|uniref:hypothetical protein n=1 Tax=Arthrobacter sp. Soil764 TaxID=1736403 RepID=UPI000AD2EC9B|nr:hypothetical protein [Arthrobacter sp. Soil764]